jgi:hypothetical protein
MSTARSSRLAKKPAGATRVPAKAVAKKTAAAKKKTPKKKSTAKKAAPKRAVKKSARALKREAKAKRDAAVKARNETVAVTRCDVGAEPVAVEPADEVAQAAIDKRQVLGRRTAVDRLNDPPPAAGIALVERVTRAVERELSQIEVIVGGHHVNAARRTEAERRARTLASLARTLTEVRKLRAEEEKLKPQDDRAGPEDITEFRLELSRKLDRLVAEAKALHADEADGTGEQ